MRPSGPSGDGPPAAGEGSDLLRFYQGRVEASEAEREVFLARLRESGAAAAGASARDAAALRAQEEEVRARRARGGWRQRARLPDPWRHV